MFNALMTIKSCFGQQWNTLPKKSDSIFIMLMMFFLSASVGSLSLNAQQTTPTGNLRKEPASSTSIPNTFNSFTITPETLSGLNYIHTTGPSAVGTITISAVDLTAGVPITVTSPAHFEVSLNGIDWGSNASISNAAGGALSSKTLYARLVSGLAIGDYSGTISVSGGGTSESTTIAISGSVVTLSAPKCISGEMLMNVRGDDFGTFTSATGRDSAGNRGFFVDTTFTYYPDITGEKRILDRGYSVIAESGPILMEWTTAGQDHTPDDPAGTYGAMLFVNHGETEGKVIYTRAWPVCSDMDLTMSAWYADANNHITVSKHIHVPGITFNLYGGDSPDNCTTLIKKQSESPPFVKSRDIIWHQILVPFNTGNYAYIKLEITNDVNEIEGNDLLLDDIAFPTAPLPVEVCVTDVTCKGACNGEISIKRLSGNSTFTFTLDGKITKTGTEATFTDVCPGVHTLKIDDQSGECDIVPEVTVNEPPELIAKAVSLSSCDATGTVSMIVTGGTPGYQYRVGSGAWSNNSVITDLAVGPYTIEVKDAKGCITSATATITMEAATLKLSSAPGTDGQTIRINSSITDITYAVGGAATGAEVTGLPTGLSTSYDSGVFTISGTPTQSGTFNYTVTTTGTEPKCAASLSGTMTINVTITADVLDENGNGFIDRINFTIGDLDQLILADKMPSASDYFKSLKITNHNNKDISLQPQTIERVNDKTFTVVINENSGTDFETGWTSADFSTNDVSVMASGALTDTIFVVDKAGPVITKVLYEYGEEGKNEDVLKITFSEPVVLKNTENSPPSEVLNYYQREKISTKAFESIDVRSFPFEGNMQKATIVMTNGFFILPMYDSLQLKQAPDHLVDEHGNSAHEKSRVAVIEGDVRSIIMVKPVVNPYVPGTAIPTEYLEYYSEVLKNNNKNVVLVAVKSTTPLNQKNTGSFGIANIYDGVGNLVQRDIPVYQANSPIDYGFTWNATNMNQRVVNKGVYLAIVKVTDLTNTQHEFRVKIGIK